MTFQLVQCAVPAPPMTIAAFDGAKSFLPQGQFRLPAELPEGERNERLPDRIALPAPSEDQTAGWLDRPEDTGHRDHAPRRVHDQAVAAADLRFEQLDIAIYALRTDPRLPLTAIQPGCEHPRGRSVEDARDLQHHVVGRSDHRPFPSVFRWTSRRSKLPVQKRRWNSSHAEALSSASGLRRQRRCLPRRSLEISAAFSSTFRCREMAGWEIAKGLASSPTVASPCAKRARIARRVGSASALKVWSSIFI